jgi:opacity protein-like surface antigen
MMLAATATAQAGDGGFYVGAGGGITDLSFDLDIPNAKHDIDDITFGGQLFLGYRVLENVSLELGYTYLGENDADNQLFVQNPLLGPPFNLEIEAEGYYFNGQYHIQAGKTTTIDLLLGYFDGEATARNSLCCGVFGEGTVIGQIDEDDSGYMAGIGLTANLSETIDLRVNTIYYDVDFDNTIESPLRFGIDVIWDF